MASDPEKTLRPFGYEQELKRSLSLADLIIYGLVFMVPIAPFAIFGVVFNSAKGMVPLTYVIGLVAMVFTALSYREMSRAFPIAGSSTPVTARSLGAGTTSGVLEPGAGPGPAGQATSAVSGARAPT